MKNAEGREAPRRCYVDLNTPAELAIRAALDAVEALPADVRLTRAVTLLGEAMGHVADFVDGIESQNDIGFRDLIADGGLPEARALVGAPDAPLDRRIAQWRAEAEGVASFHATMAMGWRVCARELEAALAALRAAHPQHCDCSTRLQRAFDIQPDGTPTMDELVVALKAALHATKVALDIRLLRKRCETCGTPLVWTAWWQGADCVVCIRRDRDGRDDDLESEIRTLKEEVAALRAAARVPPSLEHMALMFCARIAQLKVIAEQSNDGWFDRLDDLEDAADAVLTEMRRAAHVTHEHKDEVARVDKGIGGRSTGSTAADHGVIR